MIRLMLELRCPSMGGLAAATVVESLFIELPEELFSLLESASLIESRFWVPTLKGTYL